MSVWTVYSIAFAAVLLQAWAGRGRTRYWYLNGVIPLLYGAVVAWMFLGRDCILSLRIIVFGGALPILLLLGAWWDSRREGRGQPPAPEDRAGSK